ncbi:fumarylacetoacetate hydrolase family protein [Flectobacillus major]|uniref:fumarylacetoacetate hydrolase family protein n=1 Tax=Flectobacillus major TaxID=103 RepID=UPI000427FAD3|nr:fumarylacetoacetate hydrolase family protein [Flectobacillus major]
MKLYNTSKGILVESQGNIFNLGDEQSWDTIVNHDNLFGYLSAFCENNEAIGSSDILQDYHLLAPIGTQEIWASGVTYLRSRNARMEESKDAGGGTFYDKVYDAERPELFFKAPYYRTVGTDQKVRIRKDSGWNVPEPELTLFITSHGKIVGYTVGNDMSSRSIEGENPLYLPQAKSYDGAAAIGPCLFVPETVINPNAQISLSIKRANEEVFVGTISINQMKRQHTELVAYLFRECTFPQGCYLMTGTGIVPPNEFTLAPGDEIAITIEHIGTLRNWVD